MLREDTLKCCWTEWSHLPSSLEEHEDTVLGPTPKEILMLSVTYPSDLRVGGGRKRREM